MNTEVFKKITGKKAQYVSDNEFEFPAAVVVMMEEVHAWYELYHAAKYTVAGVDAYLVVAGNAGYFKTDGQSNCTQIFIHNKETNECFLETCLCGWNTKDVKANIRRYKKHIANLTPAQIVDRAAYQKENYPWQIVVKKDGAIATQSYFDKKAE